MDGVWIDKAGTFRRRWLCKCGNQRPDDMVLCGSCDTDRPRADARDVFDLCDAVEALEKDRERLDFLASKGAHWICRNSVQGRGWRLHQSFSASENDKFVSPRTAIDAARAPAASTPTPAAPSDA